MGFLQLKKEHNMERAIQVQLKVEPNEIEPVMNKYDNPEYTVPCTNIGADYTSGPSGSFILYAGKDFDLKATKAMMNKLVMFDKGSLVHVEMAKSEKEDRDMFWKIEPSRVVWEKEVSDTETVTKKPYGYNSVKERDTDRRLDILWGMAFNNATRVAVAKHTISKTMGSNEETVKDIQDLTVRMYEVAKGLEKVIQEEKQLEQAIDDEELPF